MVAATHSLTVNAFNGYNITKAGPDMFRNFPKVVCCNIGDRFSSMSGHYDHIRSHVQ
jgi:hypothetical protein